MERQIRYAQSFDGTRIAFWTLGEGKPLVYMAGSPWNHIELWQVPDCRRYYERLARGRMLVRYDVRGTGLSARDVADFSLDAQVRDLEAVVNQLDLASFDLFAAADAGLAAIRYASRNRDRISRIVLWCAWPRTADITSPRLRAWRGLIEQDWDLMTDTCAHLALGWWVGDIGQRAAEFLREAVTKEAMAAALAATDQAEVTDLLPQIQAPVLVLHRRSIPWLPISVAMELASSLRNSRLMLVDGDSTAPYVGDSEAVAATIDEFLASRVPDKREESPLTTRLDPGARHERPDGLTGREIEVLQLLASGRTNHEIAEELVLSVRTVERHIEKIYGKIDARGRAQATAYALTRGLM